jgi:hypothetical protein
MLDLLDHELQSKQNYLSKLYLHWHVQANTKIAGAKSGGVGSAEAMKAQKLQTGFSFLFVILVGFLGMLVGYLVGG